MNDPPPRNLYLGLLTFFGIGVLLIFGFAPVAAPQEAVNRETPAPEKAPKIDLRSQVARSLTVQRLTGRAEQKRLEAHAFARKRGWKVRGTNPNGSVYELIRLHLSQHLQRPRHRHADHISHGIGIYRYDGCPGRHLLLLDPGGQRRVPQPARDFQ